MSRNQLTKRVLAGSGGLIWAFLLSGVAASASAATKTLFVAPYRIDCPDGPGVCLLVKEHQYDDWTVIGRGIEGLDYKEGVTYEIRVQQEAPPRYRLLGVFKKIEPDVPEPAAPEPVAPEQAAFEPNASEPELIRGYIVLGLSPEARSFKLCGSSEELWVQDDTGGKLLGTYFKKTDTANQPLYIEFMGHLEPAPQQGYGVHYPGQARIVELQRTAKESPDCTKPRTETR